MGVARRGMPLALCSYAQEGIMADFLFAYSVQTVVRNEFTEMLEAHATY